VRGNAQAPMVALIIIDCVLVRFADGGGEVWVSAADYHSNPPAGSYVVQDSRRTK
jgi:hypothetical protein